MTVLLLLGFVVILMFGCVVLFGAPYVPTLRKQTSEALTLLDLKPGQTLLELGSGDGRVLRAAAEKGVKAVGYELNPLLVVWSRLATWRYRHLVKIKLANFWHESLPPAEGVYTFLLERYMTRLDAKINRDMPAGTRLVSFGFRIPGKKVVKTRSGLFLYLYPKRSQKS